MDPALNEKLSKLEALFQRAGTEGEKLAAEAAIGRLKNKASQSNMDPLTELQFSLGDGWSVRLFIAICRKHGLRPFRYPRQRRTTVMLKVREADFNKWVWPEFTKLQRELSVYFKETTDHLIKSAMHSDGDDDNLE